MNEVCDVICPYCSQPAEWVENSAVYGRRFGRSYMIWLCRDCDAYVGCHNNTRDPLGILANNATRQARRRAHDVFDKLWKSGRMRRADVYRSVAKILGLKDVHIGSSSIEECRRIIEACKQVQFDEWNG